MDNENQKSPNIINTIAQLPLVKGPILGASISVAVTPFIKCTNHALKGESMPRTNLFSGAMTYGVSAVPGYATTFACKALMNNSTQIKSPILDIFTSFASGAISGIVCTPFDAIAQNQQLTGLSSREVARSIYSNRGISALFSGGMVTGLREGIWSMIYLSAIPSFSRSLQNRKMSKTKADGVAVVSIAGAYGLFSSPLNQLRFRKQQDLTKKNPPQSYFKHAQAIFAQEAGANFTRRTSFFFKAALPRMLSTTIAGGLMVKGTEYYNLCFKK